MGKKVIGIDLGTGNSCLSVFEGGVPVIVVNAEGKRTTPSVIGFSKDGEIKVGDAAKRQSVTNAKNTVVQIKRFMGNSYAECSGEISRVQYNVVNDSGYPKVDIDGKKYTPQELSAMILQKLKSAAEDYLGETVTDAVITCPAYYNDTQRQAVKDAGSIAGLNVLRVINEPTAAALAYGVDKSDKDMNIVVFDAGQGTFDVSILNFGGGVFEVLSTNGDTHLGGHDFDQTIVDWLISELKSDSGVDISNDSMAMQRLAEAAEKAKIELSSATSTDINLPYITSVDGMPIHLVKTLTRAKFEQLIDGLIKRHITPCENALKAAKLDKKDIDEVILVGGTTRIPAIQKLVTDFFGKEPSKAVNPDEAVAIGAAIQGAVLSKDGSVGDIVLLDVTPLNLGVATKGNIMATLIEANTTIPCEKSEVFSTAVNNQPEVDIVVLQGNRPMASDNKQLGVFKLGGILPAPAGVPQIEVTFKLDANGIMNVSAKDKATGKEQSIRIESSGSLSKEEIERMKAEAEKNAESDKKAKENAETINKGDSAVFQNEKLLEELKDKMTEDEKKSVNDVIDKMREAVKNKDIETIKKLDEELTQVWQPISMRIYQGDQQQAQQTATDSAQQQQASNAENVQDAEFEEVS